MAKKKAQKQKTTRKKAAKKTRVSKHSASKPSSKSVKRAATPRPKTRQKTTRLDPRLSVLISKNKAVVAGTRHLLSEIFGGLGNTYGGLGGTYGALGGTYGSLGGTYGSLGGTYGSLSEEDRETFHDLIELLYGTDAVKSLSAGNVGAGLVLVPHSLAEPGKWGAKQGSKNKDSLEKQLRIPVFVEATSEESASYLIKGLKQINKKTPVPELSPSRFAARVSLAGLRYLDRSTNRKHVRFVECTARCEHALDQAHTASQLNDWDPPYARTVKEKGKGVLVGVVDTGIDINHRAFAGRIIDYVDQTTGARYVGPPLEHLVDPENQIFKLGTPASQTNLAEPKDYDGHGTHVAGIAAGAKLPNYPFEGVAPKATLAIVKTSFETIDIARAVKHIFDLADELQMPCVVNLSLGGHYGPHDGSGQIERVIDEQCNKPGRIVVVSAGNEATDKIHAGTRFAPSGSDGAKQRWVADFEMIARTVNGWRISSAFVQVWTPWEDEVEITLRSPTGKLYTPELNKDWQSDEQARYTVEYRRDNFSISADSAASFLIQTVDRSDVLRGGSVIVEEPDAEEGEQSIRVGRVHAWCGSGHARFTSGNERSHVVAMPGTAYSAITVASYATNKSWESLDGNQALEAVKLGDISYFSSPGPDRDDFVKPEIAAPGQWIVAALSKDAIKSIPDEYIHKSKKFTAMQGTSMASPYVAGAVALMLEREPDLRWDEVKRRLIKSAHADEFTMPVWNPRWGFGKLNVRDIMAYGYE